MSTTSSWVPGAGATHLFGLHNLAYGSARVGDAPTGAGRGAQMLVVRIGDSALQLAAACRALLPELAPLVDSPTLNALLASTPATWQRLRSALVEWLGDDRRRAVLEPLLVPLDELSCRLPFEVADFVDFNASEHHAANVGRLFRPGNDPLPAAWKHLPIAYHGRAGTVVVSGTPVRRPVGLRRRSSGGVGLGPSEQ
ncbi:MAG TPA: hypothetical protein VMD59_06465, partial [Acidimicrobiales bacterium]|nr:hypothetical protein [Acidimicrobiales bacterium]